MPAKLFPHAAVASPNYLASSAGLAILTSGGNAADAAVAANLVLAVVYPHMCGLGGDLFAIVWNEGEIAGLNSSGRLPAAASLEGESVPLTGIGSATVPGAVAGWRALLERYGTRSLSELARPAIRLAREGCPRAPFLKRSTAVMSELLRRDPEASRIYLSEDPLVQADLAASIETIDDFYTGPAARNAPPPLASQDFAAHRAEWVEPVHTSFSGVEVYEMPSNSRGHLVVEALDRLEPLDGLGPDDAEYQLRLARAIGATDDASDTIYLCVRDESGMSVSLNQSLFNAFGSGVVIPGTGVLLHNRASYFKRDEYKPGARPTHTLAPAMALRDGKPRLIFGTMGGDTQVQTHMQLLARIIYSGQDIADAIAAPRWVRREGGALRAEPGLPDIGAEPQHYPDLAGHAHAILVEPGHLAAAHDPRSDGATVGY
jgi:gamma-glutamyltranspeptidase/glutathione hydrolase